MKSFSVVALFLAVTAIAFADTGSLETESRTLEESSNRALKMKMGKAFGGPKEARFDFKSMPKEHGGPKGKGWKEGPHAKGGKGHGPWEMEEESRLLKAGPKEYGGPKGKGGKEFGFGPGPKGGKGHGPWEMEERSLKAGAGAKGGKFFDGDDVDEGDEDYEHGSHHGKGKGEGKGRHSDAHGGHEDHGKTLRHEHGPASSRYDWKSWVPRSKRIPPSSAPKASLMKRLGLDSWGAE